MSLVITHDEHTGLHLATDGRWMMSTRDKTPVDNRGFRVDVIDLLTTSDPSRMVPSGVVYLKFGASSWIGVAPNRELYNIHDSFLPFLEQNFIC